MHAGFWVIDRMVCCWFTIVAFWTTTTYRSSPTITPASKGLICFLHPDPPDADFGVGHPGYELLGVELCGVLESSHGNRVAMLTVRLKVRCPVH